MRNRAWIVYPVVAGLAMVVWYLVDRPPIMFNLIGLASPVLILVALRMWKPEKRLPWILFAVGQFVFITGDVISYNYATFNGAFPKLFPLDADGLTPFPGLADAFYLAVYVFLIAGVLVLIHARTPGRDRASFVDALMLSIGLGTISWVLLISPQANAEGVPFAVKLTSMAYPMMDVLLLAAAIRLAVGAGRKPPAFWFMISAIVTLFVTDAIYGWLNLYTANGYQPGQGPLEAGWMAFYVLFAVAALHPSMRVLSEQARRDGSSPLGAAAHPVGGRIAGGPVPDRLRDLEGRSDERSGVDRRDDRLVHPFGGSHVGPDAETGGIPAARAGAPRGGCQPRHRDEP